MESAAGAIALILTVASCGLSAPKIVDMRSVAGVRDGRGQTAGANDPDIAGRISDVDHDGVPCTDCPDKTIAIEQVSTDALVGLHRPQILAVKLAMQQSEAMGIVPAQIGKDVFVDGTRLVGGEEDVGDPSVGCLLLVGQVHCTATVIGAKTLITAAHCVDGYPISQLRFVTGIRALSGQARVYRVNGKLIHEEYNRAKLGEHDVALVYLKDEFTEGPPARLPDTSPTLKLEDQDSLRFVGYGYAFVTSDGDKWGIGKKLKAYMGIRDFKPTTFSYGDKDYNTCNGDSGGPAFMGARPDEAVLGGITSWGDTPCQEYGVDMRVDYYVPWIRSHMEAP